MTYRHKVRVPTRSILLLCRKTPAFSCIIFRFRAGAYTMGATARPSLRLASLTRKAFLMLSLAHTARYLAVSVGTVALLSALTAPAARAADRIWNGGVNTSGIWSFGSHWNGGVKPNGDDVAVFATDNTVNPFLALSESIGGIRFTSDAPQYNLTRFGETAVLTLGASGIQNNSAAGITQSIEVPLALSANQIGRASCRERVCSTV